MSKVFVNVIGARMLNPNMDMGPPDVFCVMDFKGQKFATGTKQSPSNCTWNEGAEWDFKPAKDRKHDVILTVKQKKNKKVRDGFLGQCALDLSQFLQDFDENEPVQKQTFPLRNKKNESDGERGFLIFKLQFKNLNMADLEGGLKEGKKSKSLLSLGKKTKSLLSLGKSKSDKNTDPFERNEKRRGSMFDLSRKKKDKGDDLERGSKKRSSMFDLSKKKLFGSKSNISKEEKKTSYNEQPIDIAVNSFDERNVPTRVSKRRGQSSNPFESSGGDVNQFDDRNMPNRISRRTELSDTPGNPFELGSPRDSSRASHSELPGVNAFDERNLPNRISKRKSVKQDQPDNFNQLKLAVQNAEHQTHMREMSLEQLTNIVQQQDELIREKDNKISNLEGYVDNLCCKILTSNNPELLATSKPAAFLRPIQVSSGIYQAPSSNYGGYGGSHGGSMYGDQLTAQQYNQQRAFDNVNAYRSFGKGNARQFRPPTLYN